MKCRVCGSRLEPTTTDLPFKITETHDRDSEAAPGTAVRSVR